MHPLRFLDGLREATRDELDRRAVRRSYGPGDELYRRDDPVDQLFAITDGQVKVWRSTENGSVIALALFAAGDLVGLMDAVRRRAHSMNATAITAVTAVAWRTATLLELGERDLRLSANLNEVLAGRISMVVERLEELAPVTVEQRVARVLVGLSRDGAAPQPIPVSRRVVAELARTTVPTVSRVMGRWRAAGLVGGGRGEVLVRDLARLREIGRDLD